MTIITMTKNDHNNKLLLDSCSLPMLTQCSTSIFIGSVVLLLVVVVVVGVVVIILIVAIVTIVNIDFNNNTLVQSTNYNAKKTSNNHY